MTKQEYETRQERFRSRELNKQEQQKQAHEQERLTRQEESEHQLAEAKLITTHRQKGLCEQCGAPLGFLEKTLSGAMLEDFLQVGRDGNAQRPI